MLGVVFWGEFEGLSTFRSECTKPTWKIENSKLVGNKVGNVGIKLR